MTKISHDSETPAVQQQVITACAFIHRNAGGVKQVFLAKRAETKKFLPGVWELPGGHIEFREDTVAGLKREVTEEFGVRIEVGDPFAVFSYLNNIKGSHSVQITYFATFAEPEVIVRTNPEDHSECRWFAEDELEKAFTATKQKDDAEFQVIKKGFTLLRGEKINFS